MARLFDSAEYHVLGSAQNLSFSDQPVTYAAWFWPTDNSARQRIFSISAADNNSILLSVRGDLVGDPVRLVYYTTGSGHDSTLVDSSNSINFNQWNFCAGRVLAADDCRIYLNGTNTNDSDGSPATGSVTGIYMSAGRALLTNNWAYSGRLAELAIWNVSLSLDELDTLNEGVSPLAVRTASLQHYWPLWGRGNIEPDLVGGADLSVTDPVNEATSRTSAVDHPQMWYPSGLWTTPPLPSPEAEQEALPALEILIAKDGSGWKRGVKIYTP